MRRPCGDCGELKHVLASSQACGRACLCCCGVIQSHDARRVRVYWETKKPSAILSQPESRNIPLRRNPITAALRSLKSPHVDHGFWTTIRLRSRRLVRLFFALVLEMLVLGRMTYPDTSLTISRTKAVRLLKCPLVRDMRDDSRGVVFYSSEPISSYAPKLTRPAI